MSKLLVDEISDADNTGPVTVTDGLTVQGAFTSLGIDDNSTSTAMTLDSSGNLLVGTTDSATYNLTSGGGTAIWANGLTSSAKASAIVSILNRTGTDGAIQQFRKDGTSVGSIGAKDGTIYLAGTSAATGGIRIDSNGSDGVIIPTTNTGANRDAAIDLGYSSGGTNIRFRDLYLSGGVYLGGAVAANKLDDYEEGTWTPVIGRATTEPTGVSYYIHEGKYTKIGRQVTVHCSLRPSAIGTTGSGINVIRGLPFTANTSGAGYGLNGVVHYNTIFSTVTRSVMYYSGGFVFSPALTNNTNELNENYNNTGYLSFTATYTTS